MVLLHGFIKKTQQIPQSDLDLADKRRREYDGFDFISGHHTTSFFCLLKNSLQLYYSASSCSTLNWLD